MDDVPGVQVGKCFGEQAPDVQGVADAEAACRAEGLVERAPLERGGDGEDPSLELPQVHHVGHGRVMDGRGEPRRADEGLEPRAVARRVPGDDLNGLGLVERHLEPMVERQPALRPRAPHHPAGAQRAADQGVVAFLHRHLRRRPHGEHVAGAVLGAGVDQQVAGLLLLTLGIAAHAADRLDDAKIHFVHRFGPRQPGALERSNSLRRRGSSRNCFLATELRTLRPANIRNRVRHFPVRPTLVPVFPRGDGDLRRSASSSSALGRRTRSVQVGVPAREHGDERGLSLALGFGRSPSPRAHLARGPPAAPSPGQPSPGSVLRQPQARWAVHLLAKAAWCLPLSTPTGGRGGSLTVRLSVGPPRRRVRRRWRLSRRRCFTAVATALRSPAA